jgi:hypothetical protein
VEIDGESRQFDMPLLPLLFRDEQVVSHVAQKLHLHDVDFRHGDARDLGPGFVGVGVVVQDCSRLAKVKSGRIVPCTHIYCRASGQ